MNEFRKIKAQGTIEYLLIIGVVVVISLVVVALVVGLMDADSVSSSSSKIANWSNTLSLTETSVTTDGNYLVRLVNNDSNPITITNVSIGGDDASYSEDLFMGSGQNFVIDSSDVCDEGGKLAKDIVISYVTKHGLEKTERYPASTYFECEDYTVNLLADQCPIVYPGYYALSTTQTSCYSDVNAISCGGSDFPVQDAEVYGDSLTRSLVDNENDTVSDLDTGLMWQKEHQDSLKWQGALQYCDNLTLAGHSDWRLPTFGEIWHTYDYENGGSAHLVGGEEAFSSWAGGDMYWTSTTSPLSGGGAYGLYGNNGTISAAIKTNSRYARCVRFEN